MHAGLPTCPAPHRQASSACTADRSVPPRRLGRPIVARPSASACASRRALPNSTTRARRRHTTDSTCQRRSSPCAARSTPLCTHSESRYQRGPMRRELTVHSAPLPRRSALRPTQRAAISAWERAWLAKQTNPNTTHDRRLAHLKPPDRWASRAREGLLNRTRAYRGVLYVCFRGVPCAVPSLRRGAWWQARRPGFSAPQTQKASENWGCAPG
jgi:hypothetical protein